ncbi:MAG TPA: tetratricopeptide repeat protein, partial [Steroidobacteraceae bacterium]|nr:tetratricopeptide repeat protein [Steroidobacteraceae bacterium]
RLAREPAVLCEALQRVGELEVLLGRTHDAIAAYREAIDVAPSRSLRAHAWFGLASALRVVDRYEEALDALDRAGTALEGLDDPALQARIWSLRGNLHFPRGELDECLAAHRKAGDYAKAARSPVELARALGGLGDAWYQRGRMQSARDHYERCVSNCVEHRLTGLELSYLPMLACTRAYCGPIADALRDGEAAAEKARRIADVRADMLANDVNASLHLYTGNFARAQAAAERTIELARRLGARRFEIEASGIRGLALVERGQHDHGLAEIKAAAEAACDDASSYCAPWMLGVLAHALPDPGARRAALERGAAMLSERSVSHNHFEFYRFAIDVALEEGWWHAAVEYAAALEAYTNEERLPWSDIVIERARALVAFGQGDRSPTLAARLRAVAQQTTLMGFGALLPALSSAMKHCPSLPADD